MKSLILLKNIPFKIKRNWVSLDDVACKIGLAKIYFNNEGWQVDYDTLTNVKDNLALADILLEFEENNDKDLPEFNLKNTSIRYYFKAYKNNAKQQLIDLGTCKCIKDCSFDCSKEIWEKMNYWNF